MSDLTYGQYDTQPPVYGTLRNIDGTVKNLTGCTVRFQMRRNDTLRYAVDAPGVVLDAAAGTARYDLAPGDMDDAGDFTCHWLIVYGDSTTQTTLPENTLSVTPA